MPAHNSISVIIGIPVAVMLGVTSSKKRPCENCLSVRKRIPYKGGAGTCSIRVISHVIILSCNLATYITYVDVKSRIAINVVRERERNRKTERQRGSVHCPDFTCNMFYHPP